MPLNILDTQLPEVDPIKCPSQLTFTEWQRVVTQLMARDRVLEQAILLAMGTADLQRMATLVSAYELILGEGLVDQTATLGVLPQGFEDYPTFFNRVTNRLGELENNTQFTDPDGAARSIKALALNNEANIRNLNNKVDRLDADLEEIKDLTDQIQQVNQFVGSVDARVRDLELQVSDLASEIRNARKEFSNDPARRLIDKIDAIDGLINTLRTSLRAVQREITDARSPDRFDSLAERMGSLESGAEQLRELLQNLQGRGIVGGIRVGRSVLRGEVELIPGANIAITRERNGYRIDVVDFGTCVDFSAPKIDPNNGCCPPNNASFGN